MIDPQNSPPAVVHPSELTAERQSPQAENALHRAFLTSILEYADYVHDDVDPKDVLRAIEGRARELDTRLAVSVHELDPAPPEMTAAPVHSSSSAVPALRLSSHPTWPNLGWTPSEHRRLPDSLRHLEREVHHYRRTGRGIDYLINALLETLEGARKTAEREAPLQISQPEVVERLRACRDWFMRQGPYYVPYSPAQIAVALDAAIEELPRQAPPLSITHDLLRQVELAANQFREFGIEREAEGHTQVALAIRAALGESLPQTGLASTDTSAGSDRDVSPLEQAP
jgi:hypothetical protein